MQNLSGKSFFITGAKGFIGRHLTRKVKLANRLPAEVLVHLAGKVEGTKKDLSEANVMLTKELLESIRNYPKPPLFIFASSFAVYSPQEKVLTEKTILRPRNFYGETKLKAERLVAKYAQKYHFPAIILRFSNVYGPGMNPFSHSVIATFFEQTKNGLPISIQGDGSQVRDFVFIDDVVDAIVMAAQYPWSENQTVTLNVCSGRKVSINKLAENIEKIMKKKSKRIYTAFGQEAGYWVGSYLNAKKTIGWEPKTSLLQGLKKTYESIK